MRMLGKVCRMGCGDSFEQGEGVGGCGCQKSVSPLIFSMSLENG